jgi:hypothetical protein
MNSDNPSVHPRRQNGEARVPADGAVMLTAFQVRNPRFRADPADS